MKKRSGTTLLEVAISAMVFSLAAIVMLRVSIASNQKNSDTREYAALQATAVSMAEQIQADINRGIDIYLADYPAPEGYTGHVFIMEDYAYDQAIYLVQMQLKRVSGNLVLENKFVVSKTTRQVTQP